MKDNQTGYPSIDPSVDKGDKNNIKGEIIDICRQNLPEYMIPTEIQFVNDMPRTPRGKIDYRALEAQ